MKILTIFIDMLRPNLQYLYDKNNKKYKLDTILESMGGTIYTNCFTPAPDTARSCGCLWSSDYPSKNGCNTRLKYPGYYLADDSKTFIASLIDAGYDVNYYIEEESEKSRIVPECFLRNVNYKGTDTLDLFLENFHPSNNSFNFIYLSDYHTSVDEWGGDRRAVIDGNKYIGDAIDKIDEACKLIDFDCIIIFSDHGWKISGEKFNSPLDSLGNSRDQVFLYMRRKNDNKLIWNNKFCSIMDIGPTICDLVGISMDYENSGISLLDSKEPAYILVEDHKDFTVSLGQAIELWGIRTKEGLACIDSDRKWITSNGFDNSKLSFYENVVESIGSGFVENTKQKAILNYYYYANIKRTHYDGSAIVKHITIKNILKNIYFKITKVF